MYKNIVVGTDGSDTASVALQHAMTLARESGGTLHIVHAYQNVALGMAAMSAGSGGPMVDLDRLNTNLAENGEAVCSAAADTCSAEGLTVQTHSVCDDPADALVGVANEVGADLIVVGNRGMSGLKRFMLGSVPNRISHHCPCSLLIVNTVPGGGAKH
jgi:nucleotide-binding universal stress UspA family protein